MKLISLSFTIVGNDQRSL